MLIAILVIGILIIFEIYTLRSKIEQEFEKLNKKIDQMKLDYDCDIPDIKYASESALKILDPQDEYHEDYQAIQDDIKDKPNKHYTENIYKK